MTDFRSLSQLNKRWLRAVRQPSRRQLTVQLPYNRGMTQLELLLPFAMPPAEMARDLLRELNMPALAT